MVPDKQAVHPVGHERIVHPGRSGGQGVRIPHTEETKEDPRVEAPLALAGGRAGISATGELEMARTGHGGQGLEKWNVRVRNTPSGCSESQAAGLIKEGR